MRQWLLLTGLLCSLHSAAQQVQPVISNDYLQLIHKDSAAVARIKDTSNSFQRATLSLHNNYVFADDLKIRKIVRRNNSILLQPVKPRHLYIAGAFSITAELQTVNRLPKLQQEYVQGRTSGGALQWRGAETNELFSYGPSIHALEYDGSNYPYDINGKLVTAGTGNGHAAQAYNNSILRNGRSLSYNTSLSIKYGRSVYDYFLSMLLKAGQDLEQTFIRSESGKTDHVDLLLDIKPKNYIISSGYSWRQQFSPHGNRNGFLNRVYQNSLLTPVSFSNTQSSQRSYSNEADNPLFLLENKNTSLLQQQTAKLSAERRIDRVRIKLSQYLESVKQENNESYREGTAFFPTGVNINRSSRDINYQFNANISYNLNIRGLNQTQLTLNYLFNNDQSKIDYANGNHYSYQRSSHDLAFSFTPESRGEIDYGGAFTYKLYASNTASGKNFFLPSASGYIRFYNIIVKYLTAKLFTSYSRFNSELPLDRSLAGYNLLQYRAADNLHYLPVTEVSSFNGLSPIRHREYNAGVEFDYHLSSLSFNWFSHHTADDIFPFFRNGLLQLANMASHRNRGIEIELVLDGDVWKMKNNNRWWMVNQVSFVSYRNKVTAVSNGYDNTPIAGFSDVHKSLIKGQPLGVITGNGWLKDAHNNIVIGNDGFPLMDNTIRVIGNPNPDFTLKFSHRFSYKNKWNLSIAWEWKKGGEVWNGTKAMLDYYGRSAATGTLRNTTNYVFAGVSQNGQHNAIPVNFYDPSLPVEQNRWVRYGPAGVAEAYIQRADHIRFTTIGISYKATIKKYLQQLVITLYANNILMWSPYKGVDAEQLLNEQPGGSGLDLFNLPSARTAGISISLQF